MYATQQDLLDLEGEDAVYAVFDRDRDQVLDATAITKALTNASGEIDAALSVRYELPLPAAPAWAKQRCIDIAMYLGARAADAMTNEIRDRYKDTRDFLILVGQGKAGLGLPRTDEPNVTEGGDVRDGEILIQADSREFTREKLRGL